ncbi:MAG: DUF6209 family protein [Myxococcota bacterium]
MVRWWWSAAMVAMVAVVVGCEPARVAPPDEPGAGARDAEPVELVFGADWSEVASGPIVEGATVHVAYDPARLPQCRGVKYGNPAWAITAFWSIDGGPVANFPVVLPSGPVAATFVAPAAGELSLWFAVNDAFGCIAYDSNFGANYAFPVSSSSIEPDWIGGAEVAISRATCDDGGPCAFDLHPLEEGFRYDTWARQRAAIAGLYFRVWEPGVTDRDNPDLWLDLDVRVYWRFAPDEAFQWDWVDLDRRVGNDARYVVLLRSIDPLPGWTVTDPADCPTFPLTVTADGFYVETGIELYFTVNGVELRPEGGGTFTGTYQDYVGLYAPCL